MALRSELAELLAGFEKRMKFINIVRFLLEYKYPDTIRAMIPDKSILDNVIVSVLVYMALLPALKKSGLFFQVGKEGSSK